MKEQVKYKVLLWDFNRKDVEYYDIIPYLTQEWKEMMKHKRRKGFHKPEGFEEVKNWILVESRYQFWSRCQYEIVVSGFPPQDNSRKIDAHSQIEANIDIITDIFIKAIEK